jgi:hypothetical protein
VKLISILSLFLVTLAVRAEEIPLGIHQVGSDGIVITIEATPAKITPVLSGDHRVLSVLAEDSVFLIRQAQGPMSLISNIEQVREKELTRTMIHFVNPVEIKGEKGIRSLRLVVQKLSDRETDTVRASFPFRIVPKSLLPEQRLENGVTIVIPDLGSFGMSPLSVILRLTAYGLDWIQSYSPVVSGGNINGTNEQELLSLIRNLNNEIIELRREVMLKDEELRKREHVGF